MSWTQIALDKWRNDGVAAQPDAQQRGGSFVLNLATKTLDIYPWNDGSGDCLSMRPVLPDGVSLGELRETNWGWKAPMSNGWSFWLVDMQGPKIPDALEDFFANGIAVVYGSIPVGDIPQTGDWRAKKIKFLDGYQDYEFSIQPDDSGNPDVTQPAWVPGSIAIYHKSKSNNHPGARYMTGKVAHLPRPLMVGWRNGEVTGWAFGDYEDLGGGVFEKVFDMDAIIAAGDMTRKGIGNPQTVSVSADFGYTTMPSTAIAWNDKQFWGTASTTATVPEDGSVLSVTFAASLDLTGSTGRDFTFAVYNDTGDSSAPLLGSTGVKTVADSATPESGNYWNTFTMPTPPTVTTGQGLIESFWRDGGTTLNRLYDSTGTWRQYVKNLEPTGDPDPIGDTPSTSSLAIGIYVTIGVVGGGTCTCPKLGNKISTGV